MRTRPFEEVYETIERLRATNRRTEKEQILSEVVTNVLLNVLLFAYNPFWHFGVSKVRARNCSKVNKKLGHSAATFFEHLHKMRTGRITGNDAVLLARKLYKTHGEIVGLILNKDLQCGITIATINKVFPGHVPTFNVALGKPFENRLFDTSKVWYASRKMDGVRCLLVREPKNIRAYSRTGKEFKVLGHLCNSLPPFGTGYVLDGELCLVDDKGKEDFLGCVSLVRKNSGTPTNIRMYVFDCFSLPVFQRGSGNVLFSKRQRYLQKLMKLLPPKFKRIKQHRVRSLEDVEQYYRKAVEHGWEGVILRKDTDYRAKRTADILKYKPMHDVEVHIVDVEFGEMFIASEKKRRRVLKSVLVDYKGYDVKVGSGWTQRQRLYYAKHPDKLIGRVITVQYFEESTTESGLSLRFPTVKVLHGQDREL